ncbi:hypothetical protein HO133_002341 [Letharia lupina]|uniref:Stress-response A/B barrel domain-containing protein n=1 Tax=Letharia lupina TaxID=560253 RepID=A0A8H6CDM6_9LECA|nr:uncharacterized protein HO133_002341 [Letharia lupina]KAF6221485.1 hypothetical protein HO133_002341 [Letharia lupina]
MAIIHVVMFEFKPSTELSAIQDACNRMVDLRNQCIHPASKKPYITTSSGGRQNSSESTKADYSHAFVVEFASEEDRKYYVEEDPAHLEFKKSLKGVVERVGVVDYTPGVY